MLFSLEHQPNLGRRLENPGPELVAVRRVEPDSHRAHKARDPRRQSDREVSASTDPPKQHRGMNQNGDRNPARMAVNVLDDAKQGHGISSDMAGHLHGQGVDKQMPQSRGNLQQVVGSRRDGDPALAPPSNPAEDWPTLAVLERRYIDLVLARTGGNKTRAAKVLGIDRRTLNRMFARERARAAANSDKPS